MPIDEQTKLKLLTLVEELRATIMGSTEEVVTENPLTTVTVQNTGEAQNNVPVTFGQVFKQGHIPSGVGIKGAQLDVKTTYKDGSVCHGVVSLIVPKLDKAESFVFNIVPTKLSDKQLEVVPFDVKGVVKIILNGVTYTTSVATSTQTWLQGGVANEQIAQAPLYDAKGNVHPHLTTIISARKYADSKVKVDVTVENTWAYEPAPQNFTYDVEIKVGDKITYQQKALTHFHHARWRHVAWIGEESKIHVQHNTKYLIESKAFPNYDQSVKIAEKDLEGAISTWNGAKIQPMGIGAAIKSMATTGGRNDIGILPGWAAAYLLSMDERAKIVTMGTADLAGSWAMHYRDKTTGYPVSILDFPYMTILGKAGDTRNPKTGLREAFPDGAVGADTKVPYSHDSSHQPSFAYLPYVLSGDYYYLEELQFWAMWNVIAFNPGYRKNIEGIIQRTQVRGQAWNLRTLGHAAYITPDAHKLKEHFVKILNNNIKWYTENLVENPSANKLGFIETNGVVYAGKTAVGPWQDDFFTSVVGHLIDLGFDNAQPLMQWKAKFPIGRMIGDGVCWLAGCNYSYAVRPAEDKPYFTSFREAYAQTVGPETAELACGDDVAKALGNKPNDMGGYPSVVTGFPSNMQPALAYAADYAGEDGKKAWKLFQSRSIKPDYGRGAQFAIVPREE